MCYTPKYPYNPTRYDTMGIGIDWKQVEDRERDKQEGWNRLLPLPTDAADRKEIPVATGFIDYFPDAIVCVAQVSKKGNDQHNPNKPLHWDRSKSGDESDALMRHFLERGTLDSDGVRHSAKVAWRAMAMLQKELESAS